MAAVTEQENVSNGGMSVGKHAHRTTRSSILVGYADLAQSLGLNPAVMVERVGLDTRCLVDSEVRISASLAAQLLELSAIEASITDFGLRLAESRGVPDLGPLNLLLREEPTLHHALSSLARYFSVHSTNLAVRLQVQEGMPIVAAEFIGAEQGPSRQSREMVVASLFKFLLWLKGGEWRPRSVCFSHAAPASLKAYRRIFGCPIHFDQEFDGIVLAQDDLHAALSHADPMLRSHAERYLNSLIATDDDNFEDSVRKLIAVLLPLGRCSAANAAQRLGMDRSTLTRRLARAGQSYSTILQSVRVGLAAHRVATGGASLTSVADALGFSSLSAFSHWFQLTFGRSAREWRRNSGHSAQGSRSLPGEGARTH